MAAVDLPHDGPTLRLLRLRAGVSQRAIARTMGRRPSRISTIENSHRLAPATVQAFVAAVHLIVATRERMTLDDVL